MENQEFELVFITDSDTDNMSDIMSDFMSDKKELANYSYISNGLYFEYFVGYEIAALLGYKNPKDVISKNISKCNRLEFREFPGVKEPELDPRTILITRDGAIEILIKTRKRISPDILHILKSFGIDTTNRKCLTKEQQTLSALTNSFKTEKFEDQFKIGRYYLDLYFPEYKIVVECDENGHADRKPYKERERMDFVNEKLGLTDDNWVRFNPDEKDFDISKVIGKIYTRINLLKSVQIETLLQQHVSLPAPPIEDEDESNDDEAIKELNDKNTFKQIREICKELDIIQLGNKMNMIKRIVKYNKQKDLKKETETIERCLEEQKQPENDKKIYQYNNKGVFISKYKNITNINIDGLKQSDIQECLDQKITKAGDFIWRYNETTFSINELKEINRKNCMIIIKIDTNGNEIERYSSIKETSEKNNIGRGVIDRMVANSEFRDGIGYKILNRENKVSVLTDKQKEELILDFKNGVSIDDLCIKYKRVRKYMKALIRKIK